jgi:hypothetical protein
MAQWLYIFSITLSCLALTGALSDGRMLTAVTKRDSLKRHDPSFMPDFAETELFYVDGKEFPFH